MKHSEEIIGLLKDQGFQLNRQLENTINLLAYEVFEEGKKDGLITGKIIGVDIACKEIEGDINILRSKFKY